MASRRTEARGTPTSSSRNHEYFVPKDGIDREVITADICRYLGHDALVRPGFQEDPARRTRQEGYFITAYRNLTSAMIADLKSDSARWEAERRATRGAGVDYLDSRTHENRHGPSSGAHSSREYMPSAPVGHGQYDSSAQYQPSGFSQPVSGYGAQPISANSGNYYYAGSDMRIDVDEHRRAPAAPGPYVSGSAPNYAAPRTAHPQEDRAYGYSQPPPVQPSYAHTPTSDYGRGAYNHSPSSSVTFQDRSVSNLPATVAVPAPYSQQMDTSYEQPSGRFDSSSYQQPSYSQPPMDSPYGAAAPSGSRQSARPREPDPRESRERESHRRRH